MNNSLVIGPNEQSKLLSLRESANLNPVDMERLIPSLKTEKGKIAHRAHMTSQTVVLPLSYWVTFSIEINTPYGAQRHMSMSTQRKGFVPNPIAVWMVAELLGFAGSLDECMHYIEELQGHGKAVNVIQAVQHEARQV